MVSPLFISASGLAQDNRLYSQITNTHPALITISDPSTGGVFIDLDSPADSSASRTQQMLQGLGSAPFADQDPRRKEGVVIELQAAPVLERYAELMTRRRGNSGSRGGLLANDLSDLKEHRVRAIEEQDSVLNSLNANLARSFASYQSVSPSLRFYSALNAVVLRDKSLHEIQQLVNSDPELAARVKKIQPETAVRALLTESVGQINAPEVWGRVSPSGVVLSGLGTRIGIIDTGVDYTHKDLGGCFGPTCKVAGGYDFVNNDPDPIDDNGHGTHCAATAAGDGSYTDGLGAIQPLRGVAPDASLYAYKVLNSSGTGYDTHIIAALEACADPNSDSDYSDRLDVCSLSLGGEGSPDSLLSRAVDNVTRAGVVVVAAAGNSGITPRAIGSPGDARLAITVAASCKPGSTDSACAGGPIARFSSRGPIDGFPEILKPDVAAPGVDICAARLGTVAPERVCLDGKRIAISGTSMATPHVAGLAALLRQASPGATPAQIKEVLLQTATDLGVAREAQGAGLVDAQRAVDRLLINEETVQVIGAPISLAVLPTGLITEVYRSVTLRSLASYPIELSATFSTGQTGIDATMNPSSFILSPGASQTVDIRFLIDINQVTANSRWSGQLRFGTPGSFITVTVSGMLSERVAIETKSLDFGIANGHSTSWNATAVVKLSNMLRDSSVSYSFSTKCCGTFGKRSTPGITARAALDFITIPPSSSVEVPVTINAEGNDFQNNLGQYDGELILSSSHETVSIPITFFKGWAFKFTFKSSIINEFWSVAASLSNKSRKYNYSTSIPAREGLLKVAEPGPWQGSAYFGHKDLENHAGTNVFKIDLDTSQAINEVNFDPAEAQQTITFEPLRMPDGSEPQDSLHVRRILSIFLPRGYRSNVSYLLGSSRVQFRVNTLTPDVMVASQGHAQRDSELFTWSYFFRGDSRPGDLRVSQGPFMTKYIGLPPQSNAAEATRLVVHSCMPGACFRPRVPGTLVAPGELGVWHASVNHEIAPSDDSLASAWPFMTLDALPASDRSFETPGLWWKRNSIRSSGLSFYADSAVVSGVRCDDILEYAPTSANLVRAGFANGVAYGAGPDYSIGVLTFDRETLRYRSRAFGYLAPLFVSPGGVVKRSGFGALTQPLYQLYYQDALVKSDRMTNGNDDSPTVTHKLEPKAGTYRLDIQKASVFEGLGADTKISMSFTVPSQEEEVSPIDLSPPSIKYLGLVGNGLVQHTINPAAENTLHFALNPNQGCTKIWDQSWGWAKECDQMKRDTLQGVRIEQSPDGIGWSELSPELVGEGEYKVSIPTSLGASVHHFRINALDESKNSFAYEFQIPVGQALVIPTPTPLPTPPSARPLPKPKVSASGGNVVVSLPKLASIDLAFEQEEAKRQLQDVHRLQEGDLQEYSDITKFVGKCSVYAQGIGRTRNVSAQIRYARGARVKFPRASSRSLGSFSYKCRFVSAKPYSRVLGTERRSSPVVALPRPQKKRVVKGS